MTFVGRRAAPGSGVGAIGVPTLSAALFAATALGACPALGQSADALGASASHPHEAPPEQHFAVELRFGPYLPNVDDGVSGTPFRDVFGDDNRYLVGLEFDWQALRFGKLGSLGPGIGWGFTSASADALLSDRSGRAAQSTSLSVMPMYLVLVARVDALARTDVLPLVGYAKAGLGDALWWSKSGGETSEAAGVSGEGSSYGYQFAVGGMLLLDYFERETAASMERASGVTNSYAFIEWYFSDLDGFGANQLQAGTSTWMTGLAIEL